MRHAYPSSVPGVADDWFADHMLPEGAHNHAQDWTVMFHNRDRKGLDEDWPSPLRPDEGGEDSGKHRVGIEEGRGYFLHCLNLVRKKDDPTVRRGAVVKAMCVCSRYNFIEVCVFVCVSGGGRSKNRCHYLCHYYLGPVSAQTVYRGVVQ